MAFHLAREKKNHHVSILGGQKYTRHINSRLQPIPLAKTSPRDSKLIHTGSLKTSSCLRQTFPCPKQIVRQFLQSPSSMAFSQPPYSLVSPAHCPNYCLQKGTAHPSSWALSSPAASTGPCLGCPQQRGSFWMTAQQACFAQCLQSFSVPLSRCSPLNFLFPHTEGLSPRPAHPPWEPT